MLRLSLLSILQLQFVEVKANLFYKNIIKLIRSDMDVNEHERLPSVTLSQQLK